VFSGVIIPEELDGGGDEETGDTTVADAKTPTGIFVNMSLRSACFTDNASF
jgi:hypothetical protein